MDSCAAAVNAQPLRQRVDHHLGFPFSVPVVAGGETIELRCLRSLRLLPHKRLVCLAQMPDGTRVVAKVFLHKSRATRHLQREKRGLAALQQAGIAVPQLLGQGYALPGKEPVLLTSYLAAGVPFTRSWQEAEDEAQRQALIEKVAEVMARLHSYGLCHNDAHPNNFLLVARALYAVDGGAVTFKQQGRPLGRGQSLTNLGATLAQVPAGYDGLLPHIAAVYASHRGWAENKALAARLAQQVRKQRRQLQKQHVKKIYRDTTAYSRTQTWRRLQLCRRDWWDEALQQLLADPDASMATGQLLKKGNTSTVALVDVAGRMLVIKRYNIKSFSHLLSRCWRPSRAWHCWRNAHLLRFHDIPTPQPIAFVEQRRGPWRLQAYYITEYRPGITADQWFRQCHHDNGDIEPMVAAFVALFARLTATSITHGDMKATNFIVEGKNLVVTDLDAMRWWPCWLKSGFRRRVVKDRQRLLQNWVDMPIVRQLFDQQLDLLSAKQGVAVAKKDAL